MIFQYYVEFPLCGFDVSNVCAFSHLIVIATLPDSKVSKSARMTGFLTLALQIENIDSERTFVVFSI